MYCPFLKRIDYYNRYNLKVAIQEETFCNCKQEGCMAYYSDTFGNSYCKLIEKKN